MLKIARKILNNANISEDEFIKPEDSKPIKLAKWILHDYRQFKYSQNAKDLAQCRHYFNCALLNFKALNQWIKYNDL